MRIVGVWLLLGLAAWGQVFSASRRYAERTPLQYQYGPVRPAVASSTCNSVTYSLAALAGQQTSAGAPTAGYPITCIQPTALLTDANEFASTSNFTQLVVSSGATFTATGGTGTFATGATAANTISVTSTASSMSLPNQIVSVEIASYDTQSFFELAFSSPNTGGSGRNAFICGYNPHTGLGFINAESNGSSTSGPTVSITAPTAPFYMACSINGPVTTLWIGSSTSLVPVLNANMASTLNPITAAYSTYQTAMQLVNSTGSASTWTFAHLYMGMFGGTGVVGIRPIVYADGRPYMRGSTMFFVAQQEGGSYFGGSSAVAGYGGIAGIYSYDLVAQTLTLMSVIAVTLPSSAGVDPQGGGGIIYDPPSGTESYIVQNANSSASLISPMYATQLIATDDWLGSGKSHTTPAATAISTLNPTDGTLHPFMVCSQWSYSSSTCGLWQASYADIQSTTTPDQSLPAAGTSTSAPSSNAFTTLFADSTNGDMEGTFINRTATGSTGRSLYQVMVSEFSYTFTGVAEDTIDLPQAYLGSTNVGRIQVSSPRSPIVPPSPAPLSYGNTEYYLSSAGPTQYGGGVPAVATAPKYSAQTNWPIIDQGGTGANTGTVSSTTSNSFPFSSGDWIVAYCAGVGGSTPASAAITSSLSIGSFTSDLFQITTGNDFQQLSHVKATAGGSSTFTCTPNVSSAQLYIVVLAIKPGFTTTTDLITAANDATTGTLYTSPTFSTTAEGIIVSCVRLHGNSMTNFEWTPGLIGPFLEGQGLGTTQNTQCSMAVTDAAQTSITANRGLTGSGASWGITSIDGAIISFK